MVDLNFIELVFIWQIADELTQTQGKVEATKDTVKELNKKLEPVEVHWNCSFT